jgi:hypothetical protein
VRLKAAVLLLITLALTACQSAPPHAADTKPVTYGDWTVRQGGYVRVESGVVR